MCTSVCYNKTYCGSSWKVRSVAVLLEASKRGDMMKSTEAQKAGANLTSTDSAGMTCLHHAARFGHKDIVKFIIENGKLNCVVSSYN